MDDLYPFSGEEPGRFAELLRAEEQGAGRPPESHLCDHTCVCPVHRTPLLWARSNRLHACQDPDCRYATGIENNRTEGEAHDA